MVKVPATPAGIPAIRQLIGRGLSINITLLFSVSVYEHDRSKRAKIPRKLDWSAWHPSFRL
jgi:transaldolase